MSGRASDYHWCGNYACYKCGELETSGRRDARPQPQSQRYSVSRVVKEERSETEEEDEECEEYEVEEEECEESVEEY